MRNSPATLFPRGAAPAAPLNSVFNPPVSRQQYALPPEVQAVLEKPVSWFSEDARRKPDVSETALTHVAFVLDKSGSMETGKGITIEGFNTQLNIVREGSAQAGETLMSFLQFSHEHQFTQTASPVCNVEPLSLKNYVPGGYTALYDAIGDMLALLLRQPRIESAACATLVTIFTDGEENASRRYTAETLKSLIERLEATGRWTFALVGPRDGVGTLASLLAVDRANVTGFEPTSTQSRGETMSLMAAASTCYMSARSAGVTQVSGLYGTDADFEE